MKNLTLVPRFAAAMLLAVSTLSHGASTIPGDVTGLWFDANHPGWGMNLVQQNDAAVATVFVYDSNGMPTWYVASRLEARVPSGASCGVKALEGPLYRTQWPGFVAGPDPHGNFQVASVGSITVFVATDASCDLDTAEVVYSIDGTGAEVNVTRQTWASNQAKLYGTFSAGIVFPAPTAPCADANAVLPVAGRQLSIIGAAGTSPSEVSLSWGTGVDTSCEIRGTYSQAGQFGAIAGTLSCGPIGSPVAAIGPVRVSRLYAGDSGFVGEVSLDRNSCISVGAIAAARRP